VYLCLVGERGGEGNGATLEEHMENAASTQHGIRRASSMATYDIPSSIHFTISLPEQQHGLFFLVIAFVYTAMPELYVGHVEPYVGHVAMWGEAAHWAT